MRNEAMESISGEGEHFVYLSHIMMDKEQQQYKTYVTDDVFHLEISLLKLVARSNLVTIKLRRE